MMKNYVLQKKKNYYSAKKWGCRGTPGTPGVDGSVFLRFVIAHVK